MAAGRCYHGGAFNISASVKAYYCLKICGEDIDAPSTCAGPARRSSAMAAPRTSNIFTLIQLALCSARCRGAPCR